MKNWITLAIICASAWALHAQKPQEAAVIGFYNLENLFDTLDAPDVRDEEFTPGGGRGWNSARYAEKQAHMARVIADIGTDFSPAGAVLLGVSEVENRKVLEDLVAQPAIAERHYQIIHFDSPDERGIDVALLYQPRYFQPLYSKVYPLYLKRRDGSTDYTRDLLVVGGLLLGDTVHVLVNHWPSRSGGEQASRHKRIKAAQQVKQVVDSLCAAQPTARILIMGDLNDDPTSPSVRDVLHPVAKKRLATGCTLYNPMFDLYRRGFGTLAWRDTWNLFDQIIVTGNLVHPPDDGFRFHSAHIFKKRYLVQQSGRYKGYPFRTFAGGAYLGGYSDHFPVFVVLVR